MELGHGAAAQLGWTVPGVHAVTEEGFCGLVFGPGPAAAFRCALTAYRPAAPAQVHAPLGRVPAGQGQAAQGPAPASVPLAQAAESHPDLPAVHAETQSLPALPDGACRASWQALAMTAALDSGHAVRAEVHAGPAEIQPAPAMAAAGRTELVTHPMWRTGCQMPLHHLWGQGGSPQPCPGSLRWPRGPLAAAGVPRAGAWVAEGAQRAAENLKACPRTLVQAQEGAVEPEQHQHEFCLALVIDVQHNIWPGVEYDRKNGLFRKVTCNQIHNCPQAVLMRGVRLTADVKHAFEGQQSAIAQLLHGWLLASKCMPDDRSQPYSAQHSCCMGGCWKPQYIRAKCADVE